MFNKFRHFAFRANNKLVQNAIGSLRRFYRASSTGDQSESATQARVQAASANAQCSEPVDSRSAQSVSDNVDAPGADSSRITDQWFRDHFEYASSLVAAWLRPEMDLPNAALLDFGCGDGITDLGIALKCRPRSVTGVDITSKFDHLPGLAESQLGLKELPVNLSFRRFEAGQRLAGTIQVDAIFSWSTFEHIDRRFLPGIIADLFDLLPPGGLFFMQIEPLYYSPFGSHLQRFIQQPWAHLLWDERVLKQSVLDFGGSIPDHQKDTLFANRDFADYKLFIFRAYEKLNKLTADEICGLLRRQGFDIVREERCEVSEPVPPSLLSKFPAQDLLTNEIRVLLRKPL